ncbi:OLC1v1037487C1 [Oldenlandia corymbosa var. corymbosa]|uniref:OLC1v1037487C1 n=1 Tax=Oldenlandia corymbosa var. corymbosa TaxID=529605 RepID=A0AAV1E3L4_OLDCO|nr:OLC1v1037487C1 [Oldenlandia corymbosa var. corymbosa]
MAGLQRSAVSFRRQGSSGLVWDDKLIQAELMNQAAAAAAANQREEDSAGAGGEATKSKSQDEIVQAGGGQDVKEEISKASPRPAGSMERSRSTGGGRGYRTGRVSPAIEPPSPKVSACGFCSAFGKQQDKSRRRPPKHAGKRTM